MTVKLIVKKKFYKKIKTGREPIRYLAKQPGGVGTPVNIVIHMDPVLKKHPDLKSGLLKHETDEARAWGEGATNAHRLARSREPKVTREIKGNTGFWKEIKRREKCIKEGKKVCPKPVRKKRRTPFGFPPARKVKIKRNIKKSIPKKRRRRSTIGLFGI